MTENLKTVGTENVRLREVEQDYRRLRWHLGGDTADEIIREVKVKGREQEATVKKQPIQRNYLR